jgi:tetratricopeptide (TPR) repeat protein
LEERLALNYLNLGRTSIEEQKSGEALSFYNKSLDLYIKLGDQRGVADINNNIGDLYFRQGNYALAFQYFNLALSYYREKAYVQGIIISTLNKAAIISEQGNTSLAKKMQDSTIALVREKGNVKLLISVYRNIADNYYKAGDYKSAYENRLEYELLSDSIFSIERTKAINALQIKYEKGKSEARILELEKENLKKTNQRNGYMFSGIGIVVITLFPTGLSPSKRS